MLRSFIFFACALAGLPAFAQTRVAPAAIPVSSEQSAQAAAELADEEGEKIADEFGEGSNWRDTTGYLFPAISKTTGDLQNVAYAMQLRDYCADKRISDAFVRDRLMRFARITGRVETCQTLLDYQQPPLWPPPVY